MIAAYVDKNCNMLVNSQGLHLSTDFSAIWFKVEKEGSESWLLKYMKAALSSLSGYFWLASTGGTGNKKVLDMKRAFGHWSVPKSEVISKYDYIDISGQKLFSDISKIRNENIDMFIPLLNRSLFGIDSTLFFLPDGMPLPAVNLMEGLTELLIIRNGASVFDEQLNKDKFIEKFISDVSMLGGVATIVLRDSNMDLFLVIISNKFILNNIANQIISDQLSNINNMYIIDEPEFKNLLSIGVSISVLG